MTLSDQTRLDGMRALVCGASQGIGRATAGVLASQGATVTLLARSADGLAVVLSELSSAADQRHDCLKADLADLRGLSSALGGHLRDAPAYQILVNNSGGPPPGLASESDLDAFRLAFTQHVLASQVITRALLPGMQKANYGRIVNIISTSVKEPIPGLGVSNTIRGAMASWAKTLSMELGPAGITVNNVLPGYTNTSRLPPIFAARAKRQGKSVEAVEEDARGTVPVGRFAEPEELGYAIAFLASPAAAYINGINLPVDGGRTHSL